MTLSDAVRALGRPLPTRTVVAPFGTVAFSWEVGSFLVVLSAERGRLRARFRPPPRSVAHVMTNYDSLLRAILTRPDDDTPRLVLADWWEGTGEDARAAFLRTAVKRAQPPACHCFMYGCDELFGAAEDVGCFAEYNRAAREERELFAAHGAAWFGPRATLTPPSPREEAVWGATGDYALVVRRGFPAVLYTSLIDFFGGTCPGCLGAANSPFHADRPRPLCGRCAGRGLLPPVTIGLFRHHPLTEVRVFLADVARWTARLHMPAAVTAYLPPLGVAWTPAHAAALSEALVEYGRTQFPDVYENDTPTEVENDHADAD